MSALVVKYLLSSDWLLCCINTSSGRVRVFTLACNAEQITSPSTSLRMAGGKRPYKTTLKGGGQAYAKRFRNAERKRKHIPLDTDSDDSGGDYPDVLDTIDQPKGQTKGPTASGSGEGPSGQGAPAGSGGETGPGGSSNDNLDNEDLLPPKDRHFSHKVMFHQNNMTEHVDSGNMYWFPQSQFPKYLWNAQNRKRFNKFKPSGGWTHWRYSKAPKLTINKVQMFQNAIVTGTTPDVTVALAQTAYMWAYKAKNVEGRGFYLYDGEGQKLHYDDHSDLKDELDDTLSMMTKLKPAGGAGEVDLSKVEIKYATVGEAGLPQHDTLVSGDPMTENGVHYSLMSPVFLENKMGGGNTEVMTRNRIYNGVEEVPDKYAATPIYNVLKNNGQFEPIQKGDTIEHTFNTNTHGRVMLNTDENLPWSSIRRDETHNEIEYPITGIKIWPTEGMPVTDKYNAGYVHQRTMQVVNQNAKLNHLFISMAPQKSGNTGVIMPQGCNFVSSLEWEIEFFGMTSVDNGVIDDDAAVNLSNLNFIESTLYQPVYIAETSTSGGGGKCESTYFIV